MTVSFRLGHKKLGGHVHVRVFSSEFGPETTHGLNGTLTFRETEWPAFRDMLEVGAVGRWELEFVDETSEAGTS